MNFKLILYTKTRKKNKIHSMNILAVIKLNILLFKFYRNKFLNMHPFIHLL